VAPSAPLSRRTPAFLCDQALVLVAVVLPALALGMPPERLVLPGRTRTIVFLALMAAAFGYHLLFEWRTGTTPGKRVFGLRVVRDDGTPLGFRGSFLRNALRLVDGLGYWTVAVVVILWRGDGKRLGDVVGRTLVVEG
jgi:uncharacterized RDD family membrane protein YckC